MIIEFSIENFGSIKNKQTLSFEATKSTHLEDQYIIKASENLRLLKLGMIYGANASGKTTILKALDFLRDLMLEPQEKKSGGLLFTPFLFDENTPDQNTIFNIDFIQNQIRYSYTVEIDQLAVIREQLDYYNPTKRNVYKRTTDIENQFASIIFGGKINKDKTFEKVLTANTLWNNTVLGGFLKTNLKNHELTEVQTWFRTYLRQIILTHTELDGYITHRIKEGKVNKDDVVQIIKKADFQISDIMLNEEESEIPDGLLDFIQTQMKDLKVAEKLQRDGKIKRLNVEFEHTVGDSKYTLPFAMESQGTKRYYGFAGLLADMIKHSSAFPIDELESSLHPDLYSHFLLSFLLNAKSSQLICTTHNREILNNRDIFRDDAIWFAEKDENCATQLYSLADFDSSVIRDTSNVLNAYKIGKLGGVPNLGDNYIELSDESN